MALQKEIITVKGMSVTPGVPYSLGVKIGNILFTAGFVADDPKADVKTQTRQVLNKISKVLEEAGTSLDNAVKCTLYMKDFKDFASINEVYAEYFPANPPARAGFEISRIYNDFRVEIECIAFVP